MKISGEWNLAAERQSKQQSTSQEPGPAASGDSVLPRSGADGTGHLLDGGRTASDCPRSPENPRNYHPNEEGEDDRKNERMNESYYLHLYAYRALRVVCHSF
jgi:hypothetical protein